MRIDEYDPTELDQQAKRCEKLWHKVFHPKQREFQPWREIRKRKLVPTAKTAEDALCRLIEGYSYPEIAEEFREVERDGLISVRRTAARVTRKYVGPTPGAVMFALCNLMPEKYKNKQSVENTGKDGGPILIEAVGAAKELLSSRIAGLAATKPTGSDPGGTES